MARLGDYGLKDRESEALRIDDIEGQEVIIQGVDVLEGQYGDFCIMSVVVEGGEIVKVMSGGMFVVDALKDAIAKEAFPVEAKFYKRGRAWIFD